MPNTFSMSYHAQALRLCIDGAEAGRVWGRVVGQRLSQPVAFTDLKDFFTKMDAVMDLQNFPQAFQRKRAFRGAQSARPEPIEAALSGEPMAPEAVEAAQGALCTLVVRVLARQNASWQGHVTGPGFAGPQDFKSELELVELIMGSLPPAG